jgi:hypothetical protein
MTDQEASNSIGLIKTSFPNPLGAVKIAIAVSSRNILGNWDVVTNRATVVFPLFKMARAQRASHPHRRAPLR